MKFCLVAAACHGTFATIGEQGLHVGGGGWSGPRSGEGSYKGKASAVQGGAWQPVTCCGTVSS